MYVESYNFYNPTFLTLSALGFLLIVGTAVFFAVRTKGMNTQSRVMLIGVAVIFWSVISMLIGVTLNITTVSDTADKLSIAFSLNLEKTDVASLINAPDRYVNLGENVHGIPGDTAPTTIDLVGSYNSNTHEYSFFISEGDTLTEIHVKD